MLSVLEMAILMSTQNIHFHDKTRNFPKISLNICFLQLSEEFPRDSKNEFESANVNEPSVFEPSKFYCIRINILSCVLILKLRDVKVISCGLKIMSCSLRII